MGFCRTSTSFAAGATLDGDTTRQVVPHHDPTPVAYHERMSLVQGENIGQWQIDMLAVRCTSIASNKPQRQNAARSCG